VALQVGHTRTRLAEGATTAESTVSQIVDGASRCSFVRAHPDPIPWLSRTSKTQHQLSIKLLQFKPSSAAVYALQGVERWSAEHRLACERDAAAGRLMQDPKFHQIATAGERLCLST